MTEVLLFYICCFFNMIDIVELWFTFEQDFFFFIFFFIDKTIRYSDYYKTCNIGKKTFIIMIVKRHNYTLKNTGSIEPVSVQCRRTKNQHRPSTSHIYQTREV